MRAVEHPLCRVQPGPGSRETVRSLSTSFSDLHRSPPSTCGTTSSVRARRSTSTPPYSTRRRTVRWRLSAVLIAQLSTPMVCSTSHSSSCHGIGPSRTSSSSLSSSARMGAGSSLSKQVRPHPLDKTDIRSDMRVAPDCPTSLTAQVSARGSARCARQSSPELTPSRVHRAALHPPNHQDRQACGHFRMQCWLPFRQSHRLVCARGWAGRANRPGAPKDSRHTLSI